MGNRWRLVVPSRKRLRKGQISIFKNGQRAGKTRLALNITAYKNEFAAAGHVQILKSRKGRKLLILPAKRAREAYKIQRKGGMVFITCSAVLAELRVEPGRYPARWDSRLGGLIVNLSVRR